MATAVDVRLVRISARLREVERDRKWVRATLHRIAEAVSDIGRRVTALDQRFERSETEWRDLRREYLKLAGKQENVRART